MNNEFSILQKLIKEKKIEIKLKKSIKDNFIFWLLCSKELREPKFIWKIILNLYLVFLNDFLWIIFSIVLAIKVNLLYLFLIVILFLIKKFLNSISQGFLIYEVQNYENWFDLLWREKAIGIFSTESKEDVVNGVTLNGLNSPKFVIDSHEQDWREELGNLVG